MKGQSIGWSHSSAATNATQGNTHQQGDLLEFNELGLHYDNYCSCRF